MYFITTKRMLEVCFFQHTPTFIIEPGYIPGYIDNKSLSKTEYYIVLFLWYAMIE